MRLLHTERLEFKEFFDNDIPEYAILSHRWLEDEVTYKDFVKGRKRNGYGFRKIQECCKLALRNPKRLEWVWVDTCCIDQRSSAELSEAINSMFRWYQRAEICFAFLPDITHISLKDSKTATEKKDNIVQCEHASAKFDIIEFSKTSWFTRGWTLQELLAPFDVIFFNKEFRSIGMRSQMKKHISAATGIREMLLGSTPALYRLGSLEPGSSKICLGERMSWAAGRETSRGEDMAYSLLGLFGVTMPLLYGEGKLRAFLRLQREIYLRSSDDSIYFWNRAPDPKRELRTPEPRGLFSPNPWRYSRCNGLEFKDLRASQDFGKVGAVTREVNNLGISLPMMFRDGKFESLVKELTDGKNPIWMVRLVVLYQLNFMTRKDGGPYYWQALEITASIRPNGMIISSDEIRPTIRQWQCEKDKKPTYEGFWRSLASQDLNPAIAIVVAFTGQARLASDVFGVEPVAHGVRPGMRVTEQRLWVSQPGL